MNNTENVYYKLIIYTAHRIIYEDSLRTLKNAVEESKDYSARGYFVAGLEGVAWSYYPNHQIHRIDIVEAKKE